MNMQLQLDRSSDVPLQDQLFEQLRRMILLGQLKPNSRVIATRFLAEQIGVSRTTVLIAYERLISEGYLETRPAVGTFVSATQPEYGRLESGPAANSNVPRQASLRPAAFAGLSAHPPEAEDGAIDFTPSQTERAPLLSPKLWLKGIRNVFENVGDAICNPQPPAGVPALRQVIADRLATTRGMVVTPEQVIVVDGRQQACNFVSHLFQRRGERVVVECPGDEHAALFFAARGAELAAVPVDEQGLVTDELPKGPASLAYVTPARQDPLGGTLPLARREALIEWAREACCYVIEDDGDGELRYFGSSPPPLMALDPYGLVFHVGSFFKTLGAGLGLAYLVVPPEFTAAVLAIKSFAEGGRQWLEQMVIADLLASGQYDHHLRRLRKQNLLRRDCLIEALRSHFGSIRLIGTDVGTQLTWLLPDEFPAAGVLCDIARAHGVILKSASPGLSAQNLKCRLHDRALLLEYANIPIENLRHGIARLAQAINL